MSRKTISVVVESPDEDETAVVAEQESMEKDVFAEGSVENLAREASAE
jgi:hypothetical protein